VALAETVYALDATTTDLCFTAFPWAPFQSTKAAVKLHTLVDLRGRRRSGPKHKTIDERSRQHNQST